MNLTIIDIYHVIIYTDAGHASFWLAGAVLLLYTIYLIVMNLLYSVICFISCITVLTACVYM